MKNTLFSPSGRLDPQSFIQGMVALALASAIIALTPLVSFKLGGILQIASILLMIPLFFMLIKRSRDAGRSGWMSILWFILILIVTVIISLVASKIFPHGVQEEMAMAMESAMTDGGGLGAMMEITTEYSEAVSKEAALPSALSSLIGTTASAFLINMLNPHDGDNQYGPAS